MNKIEIENEIAERLKNVKTQSDMIELQKWARKEKNKMDVQLFVSSFKSIYYTFSYSVRSGGSGRKIGNRINKIDYTCFVFFGIEIKLPEDLKLSFNDNDFLRKNIWIDRYIKYGGVEFFPKIKGSIFFDIDFEKLFWDYLIQNNFYILDYYGKYYLINSDSNAKKILSGRRLTKFDLCNNQVVKISKNQLPYFKDKLQIKNYDFFYPNDTDCPSILPF